MPTILDLVTRSGVSEDRAHDHFRSGFVRVDGEVVYDESREVPEGTRWTLQPPPVTEER